jgi:hypothetical protein
MLDQLYIPISNLHILHQHVDDLLVVLAVVHVVVHRFLQFQFQFQFRLLCFW